MGTTQSFFITTRATIIWSPTTICRSNRGFMLSEGIWLHCTCWTSAFRVVGSDVVWLTMLLSLTKVLKTFIQPAVHQDGLSSHIRGPLGSEPNDRIRQFLRLAESPDGNLVKPHLADLLLSLAG